MTKTVSKKDWLVAIMESHESQLIRYAARFLKDENRARDVVQETFLRLWTVNSENLRTTPWLFTVCRNLSLDILKKEKRMISLNHEVADENGDAANSALSPYHESENKASQILQLLSRLPANQQEVIQLKFQSDLSYKEIAEITGFSVSNVGFLIHTGIKKLRYLMDESKNSQTRGGAR